MEEEAEERDGACVNQCEPTSPNPFTPMYDHFKFPMQPHQKNNITQDEELGFS